MARHFGLKPSPEHAETAATVFLIVCAIGLGTGLGLAIFLASLIINPGSVP